jgi:glutamate-1-semialdehyde aminotransferase
MYLPNQWPAYYSRASGAQVWDLDGRRYIDMSVFAVGSCPLGYADPDVNAAVKDAVDAGSMCTLNAPEEVELAELLCEIHPWAQMVRYARCGGESMAIAVRIARAHTQKSKVAFCGYHGWSDWYLAANLAESDALGSKGLLLPGLQPAGVPKELAGSSLGFRHNNLDELKQIVASNKGQIAAIIAEPQRGEKPAPGFLEGLRQIASEEQAVLIFDEVTAGFRLTTGGVHLLYGVQPDIAVFAKGMSNGYAMGAVIGRGTVMQAAQSTFISSTYWTERIGPVAALATIRKHKVVNAAGCMIAAGRRVQQIWVEAAAEAGLEVHVGPADMPPLSHVSFLYPNARAIQTLHCQEMLARGFLDNTGFYATWSHTDAILDQYEAAVREVFPLLRRAIREDQVEALVRGPIGHSGFARLA